jgi:hypothetical protein
MMGFLCDLLRLHMSCRSPSATQNDLHRTSMQKERSVTRRIVKGVALSMRFCTEQRRDATLGACQKARRMWLLNWTSFIVDAMIESIMKSVITQTRAGRR